MFIYGKGVTLLSLGNGAPDIFSTFSATQANEISLAIGELVGAALFISTCVVGLVMVIGHKRVTLHRWELRRDVLFFVLSVGGVALVIADGKVGGWLN